MLHEVEGTHQGKDQSRQTLGSVENTHHSWSFQPRAGLLSEVVSSLLLEAFKRWLESYRERMLWG